MGLLDLLDRPIAYHRCLLGIAGSVTATLMLSQGLYWQRRCPEGRNGWWWKTADNWEEETGLTYGEQEGARKKLLKTGFWQEKRMGIPAKLHFRLDLPELEKALKIQIRQITESSPDELPKEDPSKLPSKTEQNPETISETSTETTSKTSPRALRARAKTRGTPPVPSRKEQTHVRDAHVRLSCESEFGFEWQSSWSRHLPDERAAAILVCEGVRDPDQARRIIAEWAACGARGFDRGAADALVWLCRNRAQLSHTSAGDGRLPAWA